MFAGDSVALGGVRMFPEVESIVSTMSSRKKFESVERRKKVRVGRGDAQAVNVPALEEWNEEMFEAPGAAYQTDDDELSTARKPARAPAAHAA